MPEHKPFHRSGNLGWVMIAAGVAAWDFLAEETLSDAFRRARSHPASAVAVGACWGILTAHLFGLIPPQADPIHVGTVKLRNMIHAA